MGHSVRRGLSARQIICLHPSCPDEGTSVMWEPRVMQSLMWAVWVGRTKHPVRYRMWTFLVLLNGATAFEVHFPPHVPANLADCTEFLSCRLAFDSEFVPKMRPT